MTATTMNRTSDTWRDMPSQWPPTKAHVVADTGLCAQSAD